MARLTPGRLLMNTSPRAWSNGVAWSPADEYGVGVRGVGVRSVGVRGVGVRRVGALLGDVAALLPFKPILQSEQCADAAESVVDPNQQSVVYTNDPNQHRCPQCLVNPAFV